MTIIVQICGFSKPGIWYRKRVGDLFEVQLGYHPTQDKNIRVLLYNQTMVIYPQDCILIKIITVKYQSPKPVVKELEKLGCQINEKSQW